MPTATMPVAFQWWIPRTSQPLSTSRMMTRTLAEAVAGEGS